MLLAHKIELRPTKRQADYLNQACGARRHCFNQLLAHFKQEGATWSKQAAYAYYMKVLKPQFTFYTQVSSRVTRNAIDDLDSAYKHFFRRIKAGEKQVGHPQFKKKGRHDSFALREVTKFGVEGRSLRIERLKTRLKMRERLRFEGVPKQVTISKTAGTFYASILVEVTNYDTKDTDRCPSVGVDVGITNLITTSDGWKMPKHHPLAKNLKKLAKQQRNLAKKQTGSNRRAKAKLKVAKLHARVARQRKAVLHEVSDFLTRSYHRIVIEDVHVKGMQKNRKLARAVADAGFGEFRRQLVYKAALRNCDLVIADRWYPSSKLCSGCDTKNNHVVLGVTTWQCTCCGTIHDRDLNAAINLNTYGADTLQPTTKRTHETY